MLCAGQLSVYSVCRLPSVTCCCSQIWYDRIVFAAGTQGACGRRKASLNAFHREKELLVFFLLWVGDCHSADVEVGFLFAGVGSSLLPHRSLASNSGLRAR